jgi:hypothetical protein
MFYIIDIYSNSIELINQQKTRLISLTFFLFKFLGSLGLLKDLEKVNSLKAKNALAGICFGSVCFNHRGEESRRQKGNW